MKAKIKKKNKFVSLAKFAKDGLALAVIPHKANGYRPHLIRYYGIIFVVLAVVGLQFGYNGAKTGNVLGVESNITVTSLLNQTNVYRQENKLSALNLNDKLNKAAYMKAQDMFAKQYWAHDSPDGVQPWKWFGDVGYNYDEAGENLAKNFSTTNGVMTAWINSPTHKANITKKTYKDVGFAVVSGILDKKPATLVVALYASPADSAVASANASFTKATGVGQTSLFTQFAVATESITPAVMWGLLILLLAATVSVVAHSNRHKLSRTLRKTWYRHHGLYKAAGFVILGLVVVFMYGGGQI